MAKKKLKHAGQFKPGNKAAKGKGRPPVPPEVKAARDLNRNEFTRLVTELFYLTEWELKAVERSATTPQIKKIVCSMIRHAQKGNDRALKLLLERTIGPVPEAPKQITHDHNFNLDGRPLGEAIALGKAAVAYLKNLEAIEAEATVVETDDECMNP